MQGNKKFLFDSHNFDEPDAQAEEDLIPTFTEEELEAAKQEGYNLGKQDGIAQEKASREQQVTALLGQIRQTYQTLLTSEAIREQKYEEESLRLMHIALKNLFPALNARMGFDEMESMMDRVIRSQRTEIKITIHVPADIREDIEHSLKQGLAEPEHNEKFKVIGDDSLSVGSCKIEWTDGGAVRDAQKLIDNMILEVERLLPQDTSHSPDPQKDDIIQKESLNDQDSDNSDQTGDKK